MYPGKASHNLPTFQAYIDADTTTAKSISMAHVVALIRVWVYRNFACNVIAAHVKARIATNRSLACNAFMVPTEAAYSSCLDNWIAIDLALLIVAIYRIDRHWAVLANKIFSEEPRWLIFYAITMMLLHVYSLFCYGVAAMVREIYEN